MAIRNMLHEMAGNETKTPLLVLAPTGVAAFDIRGRTVHTALSIPKCNCNNNLSVEDRLFLFEDFGQFPPLDLPMYASNDGFAAYKQFREVYKLEAIQRQSRELKINAIFWTFW